MRNPTVQESRWIERLPEMINRSNVVRFLLSLALATFLWGWVIQMTDPIVTRNYREMDITVDTLRDSMIMVTTLPTAVVSVQGPESEFSELNRADLSVTLDTSTITGPGEYRLPVVVEAPDTSASISVEPSEVQVQIDELVAEVMPLEVQDTTPDDDPRTVSDIVPEVSQVTVSGPSSAVNRVAKVTMPVSLDNRNDSFTDIFTPYAIDENGQRVSEVEVLPGQISTSVEIESRGKVVSVIPVVNGVPAEGFSVQQRTVFPDTIVVDGPTEELDSLLFVNTEPVDITGATTSVSERVGLADLPAGVTVVEPSGGQVEVRVALDDISSTEQTLSSLPVLAVNVPEGYTASVEPRSITITVDGPGNVLSQMESSDVRVVVDVGGLQEGTHSLTPQIILPQGITWTASSPESVEVSIAEMPAPTSSPAALTPSEPAIAPGSPTRQTTGRRNHTPGS
jgi:YbbR domain-containing protein